MRLEDYDFPASEGRIRYPWKIWSNGKPHRLQRGVDYNDSNNLRSATYYWARSNGYTAVVHKEDDDTIVIKLTKKEQA